MENQLNKNILIFLFSLTVPVSLFGKAKKSSLIEFKISHKNKNSMFKIYKDKNKYMLKSLLSNKSSISELGEKDFKFINKKVVKIKSKQALPCKEGSLVLKKNGAKRAVGCFERNKKVDLKLKELSEILLIASRREVKPSSNKTPLKK
jgi:hypothetical protein